MFAQLSVPNHCARYDTRLVPVCMSMFLGGHDNAFFHLWARSCYNLVKLFETLDLHRKPEEQQLRAFVAAHVEEFYAKLFDPKSECMRPSTNG